MRYQDKLPVYRQRSEEGVENVRPVRIGADAAHITVCQPRSARTWATGCHTDGPSSGLGSKATDGTIA